MQSVTAMLMGVFHLEFASTATLARRISEFKKMLRWISSFWIDLPKVCLWGCLAWIDPNPSSLSSELDCRNSTGQGSSGKMYHPKMKHSELDSSVLLTAQIDCSDIVQLGLHYAKWQHLSGSSKASVLRFVSRCEYDCSLSSSTRFSRKLQSRLCTSPSCGLHAVRWLAWGDFFSPPGHWS